MGAVLRFNLVHGIRFFRITSDLVLLASHPQVRPPWAGRCTAELKAIGRLILDNDIRIDMRPGQYTVLNSPDRNVVKSAVRDLEHHCGILDEMELDATAKVQIHLGGVYQDRTRALRRFVQRVSTLDEDNRRRLFEDNDERSFPLAHCLPVAREAGIPVVLDTFHHGLLNYGESLPQALRLAGTTWAKEDGLPIVDYRSPRSAGRRGSHPETLDESDFAHFLHQSRPHVDLMLEVKDKEHSALRALFLAQGDHRLVT